MSEKETVEKKAASEGCGCGGCCAATAIEKPTRTVFRLEGLDCADCAAKLEKKIRVLPGVLEAKVNFGSGRPGK